MKKIRHGICILAVAASSCAGFHQGETVKIESANSSKSSQSFENLVVSSRVVDQMTRKGFHMIEFTFENRRNQWIHLTKPLLDTGSEKVNKEALVLTGGELQAFLEGIRNELAIERYNSALLLSGLTLASAAAASNSSSSVVGTMALGTVTTVNTIHGFQQARERAQSGSGNS